MSNLNKIKEEGAVEFEKNWANTPVIKDENIIKNLILDWHNKQMDKAYSLGIDEVEAIIDEYRDPSGDTMTEADMVLDILKQKLLSLKNKEN